METSETMENQVWIQKYQLSDTNGNKMDLMVVFTDGWFLEGFSNLVWGARYGTGIPPGQTATLCGEDYGFTVHVIRITTIEQYGHRIAVILLCWTTIQTAVKTSKSYRKIVNSTVIFFIEWFVKRLSVVFLVRNTMVHFWTCFARKRWPFLKVPPSQPLDSIWHQ